MINKYDLDPEVIQTMDSLLKKGVAFVTIKQIVDVMDIDGYKPVTPRGVGHIVRRLGFHPFKRREGFTVNLLKEKELVKKLLKEINE